ncbi:MAG: hypothetical protein SOZ96_08115 [Treponema sp.]|nr:hypothetical protein [Treponema sp.]
MKTFLITYDLKSKDKDYNSLYENIKTAENWWHYLESVWIITTTESLGTWTDKLHTCMANSDNLLIVEIPSTKANGWLPQKAWDWLKENTSINS